MCMSCRLIPKSYWRLKQAGCKKGVLLELLEFPCWFSSQEIKQSMHSERPTNMQCKPRQRNWGDWFLKCNCDLNQVLRVFLLLTFLLSFRTYTCQQLILYLTGILRTLQFYTNTHHFQKTQTPTGFLLRDDLLDKICFVAKSLISLGHSHCFKRGSV